MGWRYRAYSEDRGAAPIRTGRSREDLGGAQEGRKGFSITAKSRHSTGNWGRQWRATEGYWAGVDPVPGATG